ncbi:ThiF family adenylyltransferase [Duganella sp. HH101]|uniref:ThiF family adenylyltransferase n=1 Tax=Duganella sp. HH101 TaxID=1781066 RepID=UPI000893C825|nr:ThiF family adenylyltransferase [Duganella sp. HH101]OFA05644.1 ThiF family protein [Duganella sp. HH101]
MTDSHKANIESLMALTGGSETEISDRLTAGIVISHGSIAACHKLASYVQQMVGCTFQNLNNSTPAALHISIGDNEAAQAPIHVRVRIDSTDCITMLSLGDGDNCVLDHSEDIPDLLLKIAACYICGQVVAHVVGSDRTFLSRAFPISAKALGISVEELRHPLDLDEAVLVGAGGVANGLLWALQELKATGTLTVVDPKVVADSNLNRCLFFGPKDVGTPKAQVLAQTYAHPTLKLVPEVCTFSDVVAKRTRVRRAITTTDSRRVRRSIRSELPLEIIDASTTDLSEVVTFSEAQPTDDACLSCIYTFAPEEESRERHIAETLGLTVDEVREQLISERVALKLAQLHPSLQERALVNMAFDSLFREMCGSGVLLTPETKQVLAPLAFVSHLAGALLVIELLRRSKSASYHPTANYLCLDPWRPPHSKARLRKTKRTDCEFCSNPLNHQVMQEIWPEEYAST